MLRRIFGNGFAFAGLFVLLLSALPVRAQQITGEIDGVVRDPSGAVIPNATVVITNTDTNEVVRTLKSGKNGEYSAPLLQVGTYKVAVESAGFEKAELVNVIVNVGDTLSKDIHMVVGASAEVSVTADEQRPNIETNENSSLIDSTEMKELALNTRNFEQMLLLQPGVSYGGPDELNTGQVDPTGARNSHQLSVNGLQPSQVMFLLDGADMLNHTTNGQVSVFPTIDSIQQIQTTRNNYGAQFGGGGSAQTSIVTKAGGADFHGDAYYFFRHQSLEATPVIDLIAGLPKPTDRYNDFGYTVGGPLFIPKLYPRSRSKSFFFFSQEFKRLGQGIETTNTAFPTLATVSGYFRGPACFGITTATTCTGTNAVYEANTPFPGSNYRICVPSTKAAPPGVTIPPCTGTEPVADPVAQEYDDDIFRPAVLSTAASTNPAAPNSVVFNKTSTTSETQELVRIDHQFSEKVNAFFRFIDDPITQNIPNAIYRGSGFPGVTDTTVASFGRNYLGHVTWTARPTTVIEAGFSYLPYQTMATPTGTATSAKSPDINVNLPFPNVTGRVPGVTILASNYSAVGNFTDFSETYQFFENTTQSAGRHTLYFGLNFEHLTDSGSPGTNNAGQFVFSGVQYAATSALTGCNTASQPGTCTTTNIDSSFSQFLAGKATSFTQASVDPHSKPHENLYEVYFQDIWRATSTLTLNMGVRYSVFQAPGDFSDNTTGKFPQGLLGGFQPEGYNPQFAPTVGTTGALCTSTAGPGCAGLTINTMASSLNGIVGGGASSSPYGHALSRTPFNNIAPRVGFAWNLYGDGKTSIRGGFGIYYEQQPLTTFQNAVTGNPAYVMNPVYSTPPSFMNPSQIAAGTAAVQSITGVDRTWKQPYVEGWNLDLQQQIGKSDLIDIGYVGNNTVHLQGEEDLNQPVPNLYQSTLATGTPTTTTPACTSNVANNACYPTTGALTTRLNQIRPYLGWGPISFVDTRYFADYHGLQTSLLHRMGKKATIGVSYTFSKALANDGGPPNGQSGAQQYDPQNRYNLKTEWGPTLLDRREIFVVHGVYQLPSHSAWHGFKGGLLNGWELSGIAQITSGEWWTAFQGTYDPAGQGGEAPGSSAQTRPTLQGDPNHYVNKLKPVPGFGPEWFKHDIGTPANKLTNTTWLQAPPQGTIGSEPIGAILGPGYQSYNLDVFKNIELPEKMKLQIRAEAFNLPNHVNWKNIQTQTANGQFGDVTSAYDNRKLQFGAKLTF